MLVQKNNKTSSWFSSQKTEVWTLSPKFFTANILFWELYVLDLKTKVFVGKRTRYIFPWTRDSQCQNSADRLAENIPIASKNFSPICLPKANSLGFLKKSSFWVSVVHGACYANGCCFSMATVYSMVFALRKSRNQKKLLMT